MSSCKFINENQEHLAGGDATQICLTSKRKQENKPENHVIQHIDPVPSLCSPLGRNVSRTSADGFTLVSQITPFEKDEEREPGLQSFAEGKFQMKRANHGTELQHFPKPEKQTMKIVKYKFDTQYLACVQNFTNYCEDRKELIFDGSIFFDDDFFPRSMQLTEYVPINVIAQYVENIDLQVPSGSEYCKFAPCGSTIYDYFEDYQACTNREGILRNQVNFILNSLQCPQLTFLKIDSTPVDVNIDRYPVDRLANWNENISSFISRHAKSLKYIQIKLVRYKCLCSASSISKPKGSFPKLHELGVTLWDNQISTTKDTDVNSEKDTDKTVWTPNWLPDSADQYWISLMKSQRHGILTKLCWISAADLSWNEVFQPIIEFNKNTLELLHIVEIEAMVQPSTTTNNKNSHDSTNSGSDSPFFSTSNVVLSCAAFSRLCKLKSLSLRKVNCYLTDLNKLPVTIEELSVDDLIIKTAEIPTLASFPKLKILRLSNCALPKTHSNYYKEKFGVTRSALKELLHSRSLQELCIWRHCLELDFDALSNQTASHVTSFLGKINSYLASICKSPNKISPSQFCKWNSQQLNQDKNLVEGLKKLGFIDEECVVIHE